MALEISRYSRDGQGSERTRLQFRVGMNSGPVVAGVIGYKKFYYDIWGGRREHGEPGRIQIARPIYELLKQDFVCQPRGPIQVKGKGEMETWFLDGARLSPAPD